MSKEKNQSNKKNTKKKASEKVTDTKLTKATTKKEKINKEKESNVKVIDTMEEAYEYDEDLDLEEEELEVDEIDEEETTKEDDSIEENQFDEEEFDEDLETDEIEEEIEEVETVKEKIEIKPTKSKKEQKKKNKDNKEEKKNNSQEKIKKIEKMAKEKKIKKSSNNDKLTEILFSLDKNRYAIYSFIGGVLITVLIAMIIWPDRIAALKNGEEPIVKVGKTNYTADKLYEDMKEYYSVSLLLDDIDNDLLSKLYPEDDEMTEAVNDNAEYYLNMYNQYYGYTEEQFLSSNGFSSYNEFIEYLTLDHRRNLYLDDYVEKNLSDKEIEDYYNDNVFGDINTQHVLVEIKDSEDEEGLTDAEAKKLAEEIITKLNDGTSWETIQKDYKDKITYEDLSYQSWDASLEETFMTALKDMEDNTYSEEPVKTSYGYHVIYRIDQKETPKLKEVKDTIIENLVTDKKADDKDLLYKALISLREEKNIDFKDTVMKEKYEKYCDQYK